MTVSKIREYDLSAWDDDETEEKEIEIDFADMDDDIESMEEMEEFGFEDEEIEVELDIDEWEEEHEQEEPEESSDVYDEQNDKDIQNIDAFDLEDLSIEIKDSLDNHMEDFASDNWEMLSDNDKKEALLDFGDFNAELMDIKNKPEIVYYYDDNPGNYGYFDPQDNTININEYNLDDSLETLNTMAHEYRHKYQHDCAKNPQSDIDYQYRDSIENYIEAETDYEAYKNQIIEMDSDKYANKFISYIGNRKRG